MVCVEPLGAPHGSKVPGGRAKANYWSLKEEVISFWNLIVTDGEGRLLKYNKSRLQRLQQRAGSIT
jgi:hypothetical protein